MGLIDVKYIMAEDLSSDERKELEITATEGLVAIKTTNPKIEVKGEIIKDYVEKLLSLRK